MPTSPRDSWCSQPSAQFNAPNCSWSWIRLVSQCCFDSIWQRLRVVLLRLMQNFWPWIASVVRLPLIWYNTWTYPITTGPRLWEALQDASQCVHCLDLGPGICNLFIFVIQYLPKSQCPLISTWSIKLTTLGCPGYVITLDPQVLCPWSYLTLLSGTKKYHQRIRMKLCGIRGPIYHTCWKHSMSCLPGHRGASMARSSQTRL